MLRFSILASGSSGNAMVVENGEARLLIDAGLSARRIEMLMEQMETSCTRLDAVLVTHEHADHIQGLGALARRYNVPVYANARTWEAMEKKVGELKPEQRKTFQTGETLDFGLLQVTSFEVSHDAAEPVGFSFTQGDSKVCLMTDMGYVSPNVKEAAAEADVLIIECNHDTEMLRAGRYPWNVKRRILGDLGHLSNDAAAEALTELLSEKTQKVYLAHLSRDHNMLELARMTVRQRLEESGIESPRVELKDTYFDRPTAWDDLYPR